MQDLNDMLYFAEVAERGGFAAASRVLGLPKSRLSRRIAELEARLGVRLLQRTTRKLSLTDVGEVYFRHCTAMRDQANAANDAVAQVRSEPRGTIRVSCPVTVAHEILGPVLPEFLATYPQVRIDMRVTNRVIDLVEEGVDVALRVRASIGDSPSLIAKHLGTDNTALVAAPSLLAKYGPASTLDDLQRLPTVAMSAQDGKASWLLIGPQGAQFHFHNQPRYVVDDLPTVKFAVLQGTGIGVLPHYMCINELAAGSLKLVLRDWAPPVGHFHAVFASRRGVVPAVRHFLDFLASKVGGACPKGDQPPSTWLPLAVGESLAAGALVTAAESSAVGRSWINIGEPLS